MKTGDRVRRVTSECRISRAGARARRSRAMCELGESKTRGVRCRGTASDLNKTTARERGHLQTDGGITTFGACIKWGVDM